MTSESIIAWVKGQTGYHAVVVASKSIKLTIVILGKPKGRISRKTKFLPSNIAHRFKTSPDAVK